MSIEDNKALIRRFYEEIDKGNTPFESSSDPAGRLNGGRRKAR